MKLKHQSDKPFLLKNTGTWMATVGTTLMLLAGCAPTQQNQMNNLPTFLPGMKPNATPNTVPQNPAPAFTPAPAASTPPMMNSPMPPTSGTNPQFGLPAQAAPTMGTTMGSATMGTAMGGASNPGNAQRQLMMADEYYRNGDLLQAEQAYRMALNMGLSQFIVHYRLGNLAFKKGLHKEAAEHFQKAIDLSPQDVKTHYNLAVAYLALAEQHLKSFSSSSPDEDNTKKISRLIREIDNFAMNKSAPSAEKDALDALANALE